jgi:hypothetical protein
MRAHVRNHRYTKFYSVPRESEQEVRLNILHPLLHLKRFAQSNKKRIAPPVQIWNAKNSTALGFPFFISGLISACTNGSNSIRQCQDAPINTALAHTTKSLTPHNLQLSDILNCAQYAPDHFFKFLPPVWIVPAAIAVFQTSRKYLPYGVRPRQRADQKEP